MQELRSLADLLDLQDVDLQIDRLLHDRSSLSELTDYKSAHEQFEALRTQHDEASAALRQTTLDLDKTSGELELAETKLDSEQNRLYAGGMSARDADYLRQEVEMLSRKKAEMEDSVLELMELRETREQAVGELAGEVEKATGVKDRLEARIADAWKSIDAQLAIKESRKSDIVPLIPDDLLELYDELREIKEGVAVGRLGEGICGGCHLRLTEAEQLEAKRTDPPRCIHCRRILVL